MHSRCAPSTWLPDTVLHSSVCDPVCSPRSAYLPTAPPRSMPRVTSRTSWGASTSWPQPWLSRLGCQSGLARERPVYYRERAAGAYGAGAFLLAQVGVVWNNHVPCSHGHAMDSVSIAYIGGAAPASSCWSSQARMQLKSAASIVWQALFAVPHYLMASSACIAQVKHAD